MTNQRSNQTNNNGPFLRQEFIPGRQIARIALEQLTTCRLLPDSPGPIAVEKFCDRKWGVPEDYEAMETEVMGFTSFTHKGFDQIVINTALGEDRSATGRRRMRSTLAHEIGHGILHENLYAEKLAFERAQGELFAEMNPRAQSAIVCRNTDIFGEPNKSRWWEIQANKFMAAMLLPELLFLQVVVPALSDYHDANASPKEGVLRCIATVSDTFNVSQQMARIAVENHLSKPKEEALF